MPFHGTKEEEQEDGLTARQRSERDGQVATTEPGRTTLIWVDSDARQKLQAGRIVRRRQIDSPKSPVLSVIHTGIRPNCEDQSKGQHQATRRVARGKACAARVQPAVEQGKQPRKTNAEINPDSAEFPMNADEH